MTCTEHICYWVATEFFETTSGVLYQAPRSAKRDPEGYPYGAKVHLGTSNNRDMILAEIIELLKKDKTYWSWIDPSETMMFRKLMGADHGGRRIDSSLQQSTNIG